MLLPTDEKKLFCKRKREKRKPLSSACSLIAKKQRNKWRGCEWISSLCRKFLAYLLEVLTITRTILAFALNPIRYKTVLPVFGKQMHSEQEYKWSVARDDAMKYQRW